MSKDKSPKKIIDLNKYEDPTDLSPKNLELGLWLANHQKQIYKSLIIILALIAASFLLYSGYGYFYYFVFGQEQDKILEQDVSGLDLNNYRLQNKPIDLQIGQAKVITTNAGSDFVVKLKNPNDKQYATFDFCFNSGDKEACGSGFILPGEEKNQILINTNIKSTNQTTQFNLKNIAWQKLKAGDIPDWNTYALQRLNFTISDPKFSTYVDNVNYLEFDITNNSAYSYFEVPLNITLNQGSEIIAPNRYVVGGLNSREKKSIRISWPEATNLGGTIIVKPELNIIDSSIYKPYSIN